MYMVVVFPSQHLGEQCVAYSTSMTTWPTPPMNGALAGFSWLAFELAGTATVPYTMAGLLDWSKAKPELVPGREPPAPEHRLAPDPLHTALEIPWQLWVTPLEHGTWHHSTGPVAFKQITELLAHQARCRRPRAASGHPATQSVLGPGLPGAFVPPPCRPVAHVARPEHDRIDIVTLTTGTSAGEGPVEVDLLLLSALGRVGQSPRLVDAGPQLARRPRLLVAPGLDRSGQLRPCRRHRLPLPVGEPRRQDHDLGSRDPGRLESTTPSPTSCKSSTSS